MGYNLYITRASSSLESADHPISKAEWKIVVESDPSFCISAEDYSERFTDEGATERTYAVIWREHGDPVPFWYEDGAIQTKNPDEKTIDKMVQLAKKLNARVLGEEDEEYLPGGKATRPQPDIAVLAERQKNAPVIVKALALLAVITLLPDS